MELPALVTFGDDVAFQTVSRGQLVRIAAEAGLNIHPDATKKQALDAINGAGLNLNKLLDVQHIEPADPRVHAIAAANGVTAGLDVPIKPVHQSARAGFDSAGVLHDRLEKTEDKNQAQAIELKRLRETNSQQADLLSRLEQKLEELSKTQRPGPRRKKKKKISDGGRGKTRGNVPRWHVYRQCKIAGIPVTPYMSEAEMRKLLDEQNAASGDQ